MCCLQLVTRDYSISDLLAHLAATSKTYKNAHPCRDGDGETKGFGKHLLWGTN